MVLTENLNVKITPSNVKYYRNIGYSVAIGDTISVPYKDIPKKSNFEVEIQCDICLSKRISTNNAYNVYLDRSPDGKYRCGTCNKSLKKKSSLEKYGDENYTNRIKYKETLLKKYGGHYNKLNEFKKKIKKTNIDRYGVEYPTQSETIKERSKKTNIDRYGVEYPEKIY